MLSFYIIGILIEVVIVIVLYYGEIIHESLDLGKVIGVYILFLFSSIHMTFCITAVFNEVKTGLKVGSMILGLSCFIYFPLTYPENVPVALLYIFSFIPQAGLAFGVMCMQPSSPLRGKYDINGGLIIQAINVVLYLLLYLYLD
jgi:ABC-type uncharacterized transport system permease subunit